MRTEYIERLLHYLDTYRELPGTIIAVKIERICGTDRRCSWYIINLMNFVENKNLSYKWRKGTWIIYKNNIDKIKELLLALVKS